jgi:hypothetical protein
LAQEALATRGPDPETVLHRDVSHPDLVRGRPQV